MNLKQALFLIPLLIICLGNTSFANDTHCSLIADDKERIACHLKTPEPKTSKVKGWFVIESRAMKSAVATRTAKWRVKCGEIKGTVSLLLTCKDKQMSIVLSTACPMGLTDDKTDVTFRIDDQEPVSSRLAIGRNTRALALKDHEEAITFTKSLIGSKQLNVSIKTLEDQPIGATFETSGLEQKIKPLQKKCGW